METILKNAQDFLDANYFLVVAGVLIFMLIVQIILMVDRHYLKKEIKKEKEKRLNTQINMGKLVEIMDVLQKEKAELEAKNKELQSEYNYVSRMVSGKEDAFQRGRVQINQRETAMNRVMEIIKQGCITEPVRINAIYHSIYSCLTGKA